MDGKIPECSTGALRFLRARTTTFASSDISIGAVPLVAAAVVEWLPCGAAIAVAFRKVRKTFGTVEWAVFSVNAVAGSHVGSDVPLQQPLQELAIAICGFISPAVSLTRSP